jgi:hypothetical protein
MGRNSTLNRMKKSGLDFEFDKNGRGCLVKPRNDSETEEVFGYKMGAGCFVHRMGAKFVNPAHTLSPKACARLLAIKQQEVAQARKLIAEEVRNRQQFNLVVAELMA